MTDAETSEYDCSQHGLSLARSGRLVIVTAGLAALLITCKSNGRSALAAGEMEESSVRSSLQMIRSKIDLYSIQHNGLLPGQTANYRHTSAEAFIQALTQKTDIDGRADVAGAFGPYMERIAPNHFAADSAATKVVVLSDPVVGRGSVGEYGWAFNEATCDFYACDSTAHAGL